VVDRPGASQKQKERPLIPAAVLLPLSSQSMMMMSFAALPRNPHARTKRLITTTHADVEPKNERSAAAMDIMMFFASLDR
jgi:hypothetical protein